MEVKYFPFLPRTDFGNKARRPPVGIIGNTAVKSTDYFVMNPPPATGTHPEGGHRWWWGDLKNAKAGSMETTAVNEVKEKGPEVINVGVRVQVMIDDILQKGTRFLSMDQTTKTD